MGWTIYRCAADLISSASARAPGTSLSSARGRESRALVFTTIFPENAFTPSRRMTHRICSRCCTPPASGISTSLPSPKSSRSPGCTGATAHVMHPVKSRELIRRAYFDHGIRTFALDCEAELEKIMAETGDARDLTLMVRMACPNTFSEIPLEDKFGMSWHGGRRSAAQDAPGCRLPGPDLPCRLAGHGPGRLRPCAADHVAAHRPGRRRCRRDRCRRRVSLGAIRAWSRLPLCGLCGRDPRPPSTASPSAGIANCGPSPAARWSRRRSRSSCASRRARATRSTSMTARSARCSTPRYLNFVFPARRLERDGEETGQPRSTRLLALRADLRQRRLHARPVLCCRSDRRGRSHRDRQYRRLRAGDGRALQRLRPL